MSCMKRLVRPTNRLGGRHESGSIVLEAALVMPIVIMALLAFIILIQLCTAQMALYSAVSQAVRQAAAHIYPVELAWQEWQELNAQEDSKKQSGSPASAGSYTVESRDAGASNSNELPPWNEAAAKAAEWLPAPADLFVGSVLQGDWRPFQNAAATELGRGIVEPFLRELADEYVLNPERLRLHVLILPDLSKEQEPYLTIAVEYELPLKLPFTGKPIILLEQATERVWISDALPAMTDADVDDGDLLPLQIVSIEPSPVRPGRKASVIAVTAPGAVISLEVVYKSGSSKARNLGEATADENGVIQWTWHVSGNTTPGVWQLTASDAGGSGQSVTKHFIVEKVAKK